MRDNYVYMRLIYVNIRVNYVYMQVIYKNMQYNFSISYNGVKQLKRSLGISVYESCPKSCK